MWSYPKVIAHRGAGKCAPENTLAAMQCGLDHGFHAVEFDVMLSKDGVPVLMHDPLFGRTVRGAGGVATTLASDLLKMDAGSWFSEAFAGETVPSYEQVVRFCQKNDIWMNVEIKPVPGFEADNWSRGGAPDSQVVRRREIAYRCFRRFRLRRWTRPEPRRPAYRADFCSTKFRSDWLISLQALDAVALHTNHKTLTKAMTHKNQASRLRPALLYGQYAKDGLEKF